VGSEPAGNPGASDARPGLGPLVASLTELVRARSALFLLELGEDLRRRQRHVLLAVLCGVLLYTGLLLLTVLAIVAFWDTHRLEAIGMLALAYLVAGIAVHLRLQALRAAGPAPFSASRLELHEDLDLLGRLR
jgi:uncharacterized membrane protein YqjE